MLPLIDPIICKSLWKLTWLVCVDNYMNNNTSKFHAIFILVTGLIAVYDSMIDIYISFQGI